MGDRLPVLPTLLDPGVEDRQGRDKAMWKPVSAGLSSHSRLPYVSVFSGCPHFRSISTFAVASSREDVGANPEPRCSGQSTLPRVRPRAAEVSPQLVNAPRR